MIRPDPHHERLVERLRRRQLIRLGFVSSVLLFLAEFGGIFTGVGSLIPGFFRPLKAEAFGGLVPAGTVDELKSWFQSKNNEPFLVTRGRYFVLKAPDGLLAVWRKCTHLGCTVPWAGAEDQFHCPCHGSLFDKHTAAVKGGPAPRPLDLFHVSEDAGGTITVDTNPLNLLVRKSNVWDPEHVEVRDA